MRTITQTALLLAMGAALLAQAPPPDVVVPVPPAVLAQAPPQQDFVIPVPPAAPTGAIGAAGPAGNRTFAFVAGELVGNPVKGAPYSADAVTEATQTLADGNRIVNTMTATVYRDSEGRQRREQSLPAIGPFAAQGEVPKAVFISDPVAGVNYSLEPIRHVAIKMPAPPSGALPGTTNMDVNVMVRGGGSAAPGTTIPPAVPQIMFFHKADAFVDTTPTKTEQLGSKIIEGVQAEGMRVTITIPAGQVGNDRPLEIVDETWRSPELQVIVQSTHSDPRTGTSVYTLKNINRSEPSPTLFQVPADYTVQDTPGIQFQKRIPPPQ